MPTLLRIYDPEAANPPEIVTSSDFRLALVQGCVALQFDGIPETIYLDQRTASRLVREVVEAVGEIEVRA